ncbi:hypothetical protein BDFB_007826 [Asbolus verrucosus]|uniref:Uncharacterized protein n=1 Tax=Asbolus verrucosus TaxID=1661398 RepID=A0A482W9N3_ASBVE|nr:hypothetical protein BDFB_007826 [Asbolus verrucosus]
MVKAQFRIGVNSWILTKSNSCVEISESDASCQIDRTLIQSVVFGLVT